jgi:hypothetical protein
MEKNLHIPAVNQHNFKVQLTFFITIFQNSFSFT